jgi:hypothetical protein
VTRKADFEPDEWRLLRRASARAWAAVEAIAPSDPQGVMKESWAHGIGVAIEADRARSEGPPLLAELFDEEERHPYRLAGHEVSAVMPALEAAIRDARGAATLLATRGGEAERAAYASAVLAVAERIARAHAEAEAGGPDGRGISSAEAAFLRALREALRGRAVPPETSRPEGA